MSAYDANTIRHEMRSKLNTIGEEKRNLLAEQAIEHFTSTNDFLRCKHIGIFFPVRHEISLLPLADICWASHRQVYLPTLSPQPFQKMVFQPFTRDSRLKLNRFNIPEPGLPIDKHIPLRQLDIVVMPLLAFGLNGERLGMGGGFYDRTFSFLNRHPDIARPKCWAIALDTQQTELQANPWDVALNGVATESGIQHFSS